MFSNKLFIKVFSLNIWFLIKLILSELLLKHNNDGNHLAIDELVLFKKLLKISFCKFKSLLILSIVFNLLSNKWMFNLLSNKWVYNLLSNIWVLIYVWFCKIILYLSIKVVSGILIS